MSISTDSITVQYDEYYYKEWDDLEKELDKKNLNPEVSRKKKAAFSELKLEALAEGERLKASLVSKAVWVEKMSEKTKELASVVLSADVAQMNFEREQASIRGMESFKSKFTKEGVFKAAEGVADISAYITAGGAIGAAVNPVLGRGVGVLAGATVALIKQVIKKD